MKLNKVFENAPELDVQAIMFDSRKKIDDSIFFAMKGKLNDGHKFIDMAIENGAICIVHTDEIDSKKNNVCYLKVDDAFKAYVTFCNYFYDHALDKMNLIGITGTNGKTTIAWIIRELIENFRPCGYIGTMGYYYDTEMKNSSMNLTSPKSDELFRIGKEMYDFGCRDLVLEASSEGLFTGRLEEVFFSTAVFNNLTSDHIDIHGDMENYFQAKCLLFEKLKDDGTAIINADDEYGIRLMKLDDHRHVTYGIENDADYKAVNIELSPDHSEFDLLYKDETYHVKTNMSAMFNIYNLLAVIAVMKENGFEFDEFIPLLENVELTPGRCQLIDAGQDFNVVVDFAFTPNSFAKVFDFAESITEPDKKIIAVFGGSGDRDHLRRPGTAKIADKRADVVILTFDDPSSEDMMSILVEMKGYFERLEPEIILDRIEAIKEAVKLCETGDTLLLLGKGSDKFFLCKEGRIPYISDEVAVRKAIEEKLKGKM